MVDILDVITGFGAMPGPVREANVMPDEGGGGRRG